ncbi:MAG TPA: hypothetical protein VG457_03380 [Planctomycetota bacterium]|nr:hypothetical protein [Planctomycetota bacterium]
MNTFDESRGAEPLAPLSPRQEELMRIIQSLPRETRTTLTLVCRGTEPWELQKVIEHEKLGEIRPRRP